MAKFCPLFSGSSGNCTYIGASGGGILVDAGVSAKRIETALRDREINPCDIRAVFVTHEHTDHVSGLRVLIKRFGYKVYGSAGTVTALLDMNILSPLDCFAVIDGEPVEEAGMEITVFATSHDSAQSTGYYVHTSDDRKMAVATDTGCVGASMRKALSGCDLVLLESNYDDHLLRTGPYPDYLKKRIAAKSGHLSNVCCAAELPGFVESGVTRVFLGHLSKENNQPDLAYRTALSTLDDSGFTQNRDYILRVAPRNDDEQVMVI